MGICDLRGPIGIAAAAHESCIVRNVERRREFVGVDGNVEYERYLHVHWLALALATDMTQAFCLEFSCLTGWGGGGEHGTARQCTVSTLSNSESGVLPRHTYCCFKDTTAYTHTHTHSAEQYSTVQ